MTVAATSLAEAQARSSSELRLQNVINFLAGSFASWNNLWPNSFDDTLKTNRTVSNWLVPSKAQQAGLPGTGNLQQISDTADLVNRVLYAAEAAEDAGRITTAQANAVLGAWNAFIRFPF